MAFTPSSGVLGQIRPSGATETVLYTCPADARASVSITCCNTDSGSTTVTVKVRSGSTSTALVSGAQLAPAGEQGHSIDIRALILGPGQSVAVTSFSGTVDFSAIGYTAPSNVVAF